jgi:hypothetical protein
MLVLDQRIAQKCCSPASKLDELQVERLDLGQDAVQGRAIQHATEQRVPAHELGNH